MKKYKIILFSLLTVTCAQAQVAIGKASVTEVSPGVKASVSLEFYDSADNAKGLLLPYASTVAGTPDASYKGLASAVDGTLVFDVSDDKVKYRKNGAWFDLTVKNRADVIPGITNASPDLSPQSSTTMEDQTSAKTAIGVNAETDTTEGILVLSDTNKAMVLPKVNNPHTTIQNPSAGMIVYDTNKRLLCVFNGTVWTFWKP